MIYLQPTTFTGIGAIAMEHLPGTNFEDMRARINRQAVIGGGCVAEHYGCYDADRALVIQTLLGRSEAEKLRTLLKNESEFDLCTEEGIYRGMVESRTGTGGMVEIRFWPTRERYDNPPQVDSVTPVPTGWVEKTDDTFWVQDDGYKSNWDGSSWQAAAYSPTGCFIAPTGGWEVGYRPTKIRIALDPYVDRFSLLDTTGAEIAGNLAGENDITWGGNDIGRLKYWADGDDAVYGGITKIEFFNA